MKIRQSCRYKITSQRLRANESSVDTQSDIGTFNVHKMQINLAVSVEPL